MGVLAELGLDAVEGSVLLIDPPPYVSAEASTMTPRPGVASSVQVARPAALIVWWPTRDQVNPGSVSRLAWLASAEQGSAWVVVDAEDADAPSLDDVRAAISPGGFSPGEVRTLSTGEVALHLT
ncbi:MAG: hypothetical protein WD557_15320 [Dehalococcoidia bacterium]